MNVKEEMFPVRVINLTTLNKNSREDKKNPGRKRLRCRNLTSTRLCSRTDAPKPESKITLDVKDDQKLDLEQPLPVRSVIQNQHNSKRYLKLEEDIEKEKQFKRQNESFSKDVRYSLIVWIPADKEKLLYNINVSDRNILQSIA